MGLGKNTENETFIFKDTAINNSKEEKILGVTTGSKLTFSSHVRELCKKASQKYRLCQEYQTNFMILKKFFFLMLVVESQFNYCPLVWMFCSRTSNNMIDKVHDWVLRVILRDD